MRRSPGELRPHPLNAEIYDTGDDSELRASIEEHGVITPLIINQDNTILSGHRRHRVALSLGLHFVPVVVRDVPASMDAERILIESNRQREKTARDQMREAKNLERIFAAESKGRQRGGRGGVLLPPTLAEASPAERETRSKVAESIGMKRETYRKVREVDDIAEGVTEAPEPVKDVARLVMDELDQKETSPNQAVAVVRAASEIVAEQEAAPSVEIGQQPSLAPTVLHQQAKQRVVQQREAQRVSRPVGAMARATMEDAAARAEDPDARAQFAEVDGKLLDAVRASRRWGRLFDDYTPEELAAKLEHNPEGDWNLIEELFSKRKAVQVAWRKLNGVATLAERGA